MNQQSPMAATKASSAEGVATFHGFVRKRRLIVLALLIVVIVSFGIDVLVGPSDLSLEAALKALFRSPDASNVQIVVMWNVRIPQALTAILVGAGLALAGAEMQTILDNPLASPFTLGVSSAATLGAAIALILGVSFPAIPATWLVSVNAFVFAFGAVMLLQALAMRPGTDSGTLVLFGIALVFIFNALVALLQFVASDSAIQQLVFWTMGSISRTGWDKIAILAVIFLVMFPWAFKDRWQMTALRLGEDRARSFGIDVRRLRFFALLRVSTLASISVAFVGTIGFVGLVGPHIARLLVGEDHRFFLPASLLVGAAVMSLSSIVSKLAIPGVLLPIGIVTSLIGIPVFLSLVLRHGSRSA